MQLITRLLEAMPSRRGFRVGADMSVSIFPAPDRRRPSHRPQQADAGKTTSRAERPARAEKPARARRHKARADARAAAAQAATACAPPVAARAAEPTAAMVLSATAPPFQPPAPTDTTLAPPPSQPAVAPADPRKARTPPLKAVEPPKRTRGASAAADAQAAAPTGAVTVTLPPSAETYAARALAAAPGAPAYRAPHRR